MLLKKQNDNNLIRNKKWKPETRGWRIFGWIFSSISFSNNTFAICTSALDLLGLKNAIDQRMVSFSAVKGLSLLYSMRLIAATSRFFAAIINMLDRYYQDSHNMFADKSKNIFAYVTTILGLPLQIITALAICYYHPDRSTGNNILFSIWSDLLVSWQNITNVRKYQVLPKNSPAKTIVQQNVNFKGSLIKNKCSQQFPAKLNNYK